MTSPVRFAVYWVPAGNSALWMAGSTWLGRDAESGAATKPCHDATVAPRRYGFHATLKAPMALRSDDHAATLRNAIASIAAATPPIAMPALRVATLSSFVALRPADDLGPEHPLRSLADRCVTELESLRAPFDEAELRARSAGLDVSERARLRAFGYQHVLDGWRMHMTLTDSFDDGEAGTAARNRAIELARAHFRDALARPPAAGELALFVEDVAGADFRLVERFALAGPDS